ncbi:08ac6155-126b-49e7-8589-41f2f87f9e9d [Thermothielavioides terrestris]|uniref:08ac6155-126b-49e7-8589-41f2f87f9e9d n=1 Tax=Thermothielavioides terrestris TaxID=2587410 RepID=A0A3S5CXS8_9PEZI|nr:08ac6155-126b-49e7-8589-41f2f87f9e9d [Thermothielavioides terrestris]
MCGRYALALRPSQIRQMLLDDDMPVDDAPADEGDGAPRQSYNFAPGYHGIVYRADVPDYGAGRPSSHHHQHAAHGAAEPDIAEPELEPEQQREDAQAQPPSSTPAQPAQHHRYKLQSMKWGLVPSWTRRRPDYGAMLKTINCRADSLASPGGMWASMKARKRCVVVAQGFYEWLKKGPKEKVPHYIRRRDGRLMCFAGLWDCVRFEGGDDPGGGRDGDAGRLYTYTIITTDSNAQLRFLHDRMPVILEPRSEAMWTWLDPGRAEWSKELQAVLRPFEGELEVYPVAKEVGKVGNDSPSFVIPLASKENKGNIANFFAKGKAEKGTLTPEVEIEEEGKGTMKKAAEEVAERADDGGMGSPKRGVKREAEGSPAKGEPPTKKAASGKAASPVKAKQQQARAKISATSNAARSPVKSKGKAGGSQKITKFFGNSA